MDFEDPLFAPGDTKILSPQAEIWPATRRADVIYLVIFCLIVMLGIGCLVIGERTAGVIMTLFGLAFGGFTLHQLTGNRRMLRRMRKRAARSELQETKDEHPTATK